MESFKIKPEMTEIWKKTVSENCMDSYSFGVTIAVIKSFEILDDDSKSPKEAQEAWKGLDMTGFMAGCAASIISQIHLRGQEFREYWNKQFGSDSKEGTVNPAIMTVG